MAIEEVMFLVVIAWVKGGGKKILHITETNCLLINKKRFFQSFANC